MKGRSIDSTKTSTMEIVPILRELWHRRILVAAVAAFAILIGASLSYHLGFPPKRRNYEVGVASASILVDTPKSQVVEVAPNGSEMLASRANVLANLMVDGEMKNAIAQKAGLPVRKILAFSETAAAANPAPPLNAQAYAYTTSIARTSDMNELPIIRVQTQAPDVAHALALANAAVAGLGEYLDSKATTESVPDARRLRVRALGTAQGQIGVRGTGRTMGVMLALLTFVVGCGLILTISALVRGWRAASVLEQEFKTSDTDALLEDWVNGPTAERDATTKLRAS
jgi:hypothetical protein